MSEEDRENGAFLIPPEEKRCIWMDSGVITLKICDRGFDCERCPLDRALRGEEGGDAGDAVDSALPPWLEPFSRFPVDTGRHYHPCHVWVSVEGSGRARVGLDSFLTTILGTFDSVSTKHPGARVVRGLLLGEILQDCRCFALLSPISGRILETNPELNNTPALASLDPLGRGWLALLEPENLEVDLAHCRTGKSVLSWYLKGMDWLNGLVSPGFSEQRARLGLTMYDGGAPVLGLKDLLPPDSYRHLVCSLLSAADDWEAGK